MQESEYVLETKGLIKNFDGRRALDGVSMSVYNGEVFGLLGPNGAGKTTMIRIILDVFRPDEGDVRILGGPFSENTKDRIGYLPEEGGLDRKLKVIDALRFFAGLKGMTNPEPEIELWLNRMKLSDYREKKVGDLSKGMSRRLQFIVSVIHRPELLILDEPFYGLDPVNKKQIKDILLELKRDGMTIIMSTHQMDEVERMCDRILMINNGRSVLYGNINEIKERFGFSAVVDYEGILPQMDDEYIESVNDYGSHAEMVLKPGADSQKILKHLMKSVSIRKFEVSTRSLNDIFIGVVEDEQ
ncbi:ABC transporter ATP-binding protein [Methanoplanus endosymbiosus]|uniref:ATP-binding cassette domain-containing protein n=1 Tax=Methanoplanus endosymbiosus TaxID=33865 RepID=A0A9E7TJ22_9EURY|nr:ATP-binding cassette domain-containing protein [Methanoplanus endosymbiosus]UUX91439.1 ATP-binding cassette domain-containing protein [Methanoplanus endosymbiosus]